MYSDSVQIAEEVPVNPLPLIVTVLPGPATWGFTWDIEGVGQARLLEA
jgi:hypothetical protein